MASSFVPERQTVLVDAVRSGPRDGDSSIPFSAAFSPLSFDDIDKMPLMDLILAKSKVQEEADLVEAYLQSEEGGGGTDTPLVDAEDFPRSDIDLQVVRIRRHRLKCLQNDFRRVYARIERCIQDDHAAFAASDEGHVLSETRPYMRACEHPPPPPQPGAGDSSNASASGSAGASASASASDGHDDGGDPEDVAAATNAAAAAPPACGSTRTAGQFKGERYLQVVGERLGTSVHVDVPYGLGTTIRVCPDAPADAAGLLRGDIIMSIGSVSSAKGHGLRDLRLVEGDMTLLTYYRPPAAAMGSTDAPPSTRELVGVPLKPAAGVGYKGLLGAFVVPSGVDSVAACDAVLDATFTV